MACAWSAFDDNWAEGQDGWSVKEEGLNAGSIDGYGTGSATGLRETCFRILCRSINTSEPMLHWSRVE